MKRLWLTLAAAILMTACTPQAEPPPEPKEAEPESAPSVMESQSEVEQSLAPKAEQTSKPRSAPDPGCILLSTGQQVRPFTMDLSLPPLERSWEPLAVSYKRGIAFNDFLWLMRDPEKTRDPSISVDMGRASWDDEHKAYTINFTDPDFVPDEEYLQNLCYTLHNPEDSPRTRFMFLLNGAPLEGIRTDWEGYYCYYHYEPHPDVGYYTAAELYELQKQVPYEPNEEDERRYFGEIDFTNWFEDWVPEGRRPSDEVLTELVGLVNGLDDPVRRELTTFLRHALPGYTTLIDYSKVNFTKPTEAPNEMLVLCGLMHSHLMVTSGPENRWVEGSPEFILYALSKHTQQMHYGWLAYHVEEVAKQYYGDDISIVHQGYGNKRYSYADFVGLYSHFPGGTGGDDCLFPVLAYEDTGDAYQVEIALLGVFHGMGGSYIHTMEEPHQWESIPWEDVADYSRTRAPRAKVTIAKGSGGSMTVQRFEYMGPQSNL